MRHALAGHPFQLLFATMANDRAEIQRAIAAEGVGACVNSIPHLQFALENGFEPSRIQFTSCGLPLEDMTYLQSIGTRANLDSPTQIERWCSLRRGGLVGARINAASLDGASAPPDRIGMDLADFEKARQIARDLDGRVNGIHVYAGTNFQSVAGILAILRPFFLLAGRYPDLDYVNIGGGIGVDYAHTADAFDYEAFGAEVCAMARAVSQSRGRPLGVYFEPGRSLVAASGCFMARVTDVRTWAAAAMWSWMPRVAVLAAASSGQLSRAAAGPADVGGGRHGLDHARGWTAFSRDIWRDPAGRPSGR